MYSIVVCLALVPAGSTFREPATALPNCAAAPPLLSIPPVETTRSRNGSVNCCAEAPAWLQELRRYHVDGVCLFQAAPG